MENSSVAVWAKIRRGDINMEPQSWEEWHAGLMAASTRTLLIAYLGTVLDYYKWRARAIAFLLDVMEYTEWGLINEYIPSKPWIRFQCGNDQVSFPSGFKHKAAEMLVLEYLRVNPESREPLWVHDAVEEPGILLRILRTLRQHRHDSYFNSEQCQARSVVKKFIKLCFEDHQWREEHPEFLKARDACLLDLYRTAFSFGMGDLVTRRDEVSLEALQQVVFGPKDEYNDLDDFYEPPKTMDEALTSRSNVRREAARCLVMLQAVRHAQAVAAHR